MIEGLWIEMSSDKLKGLFDGRAKYHAVKAAWYKEQAANIASAADEMAGIGKGVSNNPVESLRSSQQSHEHKAAFFQVMADNIIPNETYRLSEQNCIRIELFAQYF